MDKPKVTIYTDGGAEPNPGPGGWGAVLLFEKNGALHKKDLKGGEQHTTNNRMELTAALEALKALKEPCKVELFTDSQYLRNGISEWIVNWRKTNFKNGKIQNADLWRLLDNEASRHEIQWQWVKSHANNEHNERADTLAALGRAEALGLAISEDALNNPYRAYLAVAAAPSLESGAWAVSLEKSSQQTTLTGQEQKAAANRLYLLAAIAALEAVPQGETVHLFTNSDYLRDGIRGWLKGWKQNGWHTKDGAEVKYRDLWEKLDHLVQSRHLKLSSFEENSTPLESLKKVVLDVVKQGRKVKTEGDD